MSVTLDLISECVRLGRAVETKLNQILADTKLLLVKDTKIMARLDDVLVAIDAATNEIAVDAETDATAMKALRDQIKILIDKGEAPTTAQLDQLDGFSTRLTASAARLREIAADPTNPVPPVA